MYFENRKTLLNKLTNKENTTKNQVDLNADRF